MAPRPTALLQGTLDLIVLQLLAAEPTNGFDLAQRIRAVSREHLAVNAGSLYPALYRLEARGWIRGAWTTTANNRQAKVYAVTAAGRRRLEADREAWRRFSAALGAILRTTG